MEYGIQMFGAQKLFKSEKEVFLKKLWDMGYRMIEPCVRMEEIENIPRILKDNMTAYDEFGDLVALVKKQGFTIPSCHLFAPHLGDDVDKLIELKEKYGITVFVAGIGGTDASNADEKIRELTVVSEKLQAAGAELWLHNGAGEIKTKADNGMSIYAYVIKQCPLLKGQIDTGWAWIGGEDPMAIAAQLGDQLASIHLKELAEGYADKTGKDCFAVIGEGISDNAAFLRAAGETLPVILDEDMPVRDFYDDFQRTIKVLREIEKTL